MTLQTRSFRHVLPFEHIALALKIPWRVGVVLSSPQLYRSVVQTLIVICMHTAAQGLRSCSQSVLSRHISGAVGLRRRTATAAATAAVKSATAMQPLTGHVPGFLQRIAEVNNGLEDLAAGQLVPFQVDGQRLGYLKQE
jgi:hypothetical protein